MVKLVNSMIKGGVEKTQILDVLVDQYGYKNRRAASCGCTMSGVVFPKKEKSVDRYKYDDTAARLQKRYKPAEVAPKDNLNLFEQAASLVPGAVYCKSTGTCRVGRAPVSGIKLMQMAGMELPQ